MIDDGQKFESLYREAKGEPPPESMRGFSDAVFARTTRGGGEKAQSGANRRVAFAALGAAAAGVAGVMLAVPREKPFDEEAFALAEVEPELLDELELCRELDTIALLEALEEIDDG